MRTILTIALFLSLPLTAGSAAARTAQATTKAERAELNMRSNASSLAAQKKFDIRQKRREAEMNRVLRGICTGC